MTTNEFATLGLTQAWTDNLDHLDYTEMTPIQAAALPLLLESKDVIGHAYTGTGKTAAFGLALLQKITPASELPGALVLCPTRELAGQVATELRRLAWALPNTNVVTVCGGKPFHRQQHALEHGVDVVVGTPGRVLDHIRRETIDLSNVSTVVLDEADRMLDMGFIDDVAQILENTPSNRGDNSRQTVLMSATITDDVREVSERFQNDAAIVSVVDEEEAPDITQIVYDLGDMERIEALRRVLGHHRPDSAVIFCNERATCNDVVLALRNEGHSAQTMHGGLEQRDRDDVLLMFSNGSLRYLVATNVAARGIDIDALDAVINYELPDEINTYTHRIGRTGRAGDEGQAINLIDGNERGRLRDYDEELAKVDPTPITNLSSDYKAPESAPMRTIAIQAGRKDKLRPGDIVGALTGDVGMPGDAIGLITVRDRIAFVAVERHYAQKAFQGLKHGKIKGRSFGVFLVR
ncbi:ATP-dependent RNA helicase DbpA [Persicimonas caeni]|uniref:ATP-dependent RNA helicase DbpA n=1 Tax=Persicimonas caeni TaxID=2292766 RepID=UPI001C9BA1A7|nr:ATP-dependent RNA helicase DbpA [Persicimonas caeni]